VDVQEVRKLDAYLKKLFGNQRIRVAPNSAKAADVFVGEERIGHLVVDDEDEERSWNFEIKMTLGEPASVKNLKTIEAYLRRKFDDERIRVMARPRKTDSAEVMVGEEYIGVVFFDEKETRSCFFEMPILELDLEDLRLGGPGRL
jgi:predicted RNA-binding protein (virulence factor B family)